MASTAGTARNKALEEPIPFHGLQHLLRSLEWLNKVKAKGRVLDGQEGAL